MPNVRYLTKFRNCAEDNRDQKCRPLIRKIEKKNNILRKNSTERYVLWRFKCSHTMKFLRSKERSYDWQLKWYVHVTSASVWNNKYNIKRDSYSDVNTILNRMQSTIWTIIAFRVLNPRQWLSAKQSTFFVIFNVGKWCPKVPKLIETKRDGVINPQNYSLYQFKRNKSFHFCLFFF